MRKWQARAAALAGGVLTVALTVALVLNSLHGNIAFYVTPTEVAAGRSPSQQDFRIGALVKQGSLRREGLTAHFVLTDLATEVAVTYTGILPDLFKEGQGAVVHGRLARDGTFRASEVLAKHDENYMPPAAREAVNQAVNAAAGRP